MRARRSLATGGSSAAQTSSTAGPTSTARTTSATRRLRADGGGTDWAAATHAALLEIRRTLERHPAVRQARGHPSGEFTRVRAELDPRRLGVEADHGVLEVRWHAPGQGRDRPTFAFHYSDETGCDGGWHHEPNPHVEGWGHRQWRGPDEEHYTYEPIAFASLTPVRVCWSVLERLGVRLRERG